MNDPRLGDLLRAALPAQIAPKEWLTVFRPVAVAAA